MLADQNAQCRRRRGYRAHPARPPGRYAQWLNARRRLSPAVRFAAVCDLPPTLAGPDAARHTSRTPPNLLLYSSIFSPHMHGRVFRRPGTRRGWFGRRSRSRRARCFGYR
ncbi:hypothetical protein AB1462_10505 [Pseudomonas sp. SB113]|uniref:hypothetical protein n=1 Tax=Pseudomonas sp. SB113 TaxID=3154123 RepID=UPI00345C6F2A